MQGVGEVSYLDTDEVRQYSLHDFNMLGIHGLGDEIDT